jgi:hypothetical protein
MDSYTQIPGEAAVRTRPKHSKPPVYGLPRTKANQALEPVVVSNEAFCAPELRRHAYYADDTAIILHMEYQ